MKPRIGISACLLGQKVRHNGEHKRNDWVVDELGPFVTWVPVCPEMEMGLGVPRDTLRLTGSSANPHLIVIRTGEDLSEKAQSAARKILSRDLDLDGFILKKDSPSCGLERVKVYGKNNIPARTGQGFFAAELTRKYPELPAIEEGRLSEAAQRENFVTLVFAWSALRRIPKRIAALQQHHQAYKLILMSLSPKHYEKLGAISANAERLTPSQAIESYCALFLEAFQQPPTRKRRMNVLQHISGYFKTQLASDEKQNLHATLEDYQAGRVPFAVPLTVLQLLTHRFSIEYLKNQAIFQPFPKALKIQSDLR